MLSLSEEESSSSQESARGFWAVLKEEADLEGVGLMESLLTADSRAGGLVSFLFSFRE